MDVSKDFRVSRNFACPCVLGTPVEFLDALGEGELDRRPVEFQAGIGVDQIVDVKERVKLGNSRR